MKKSFFKFSVAIIVLSFTTIFFVVVVPPLIENPDVIGALQAGFVNPYASGYSYDVFACWMILAIWVIYEWNVVKYGWVCLLLGLMPGVAVGFGGYLLLRTKYLITSEKSLKSNLYKK